MKLQSHRGLTALSPEAIAAGQTVVPVLAHITVHLDVILRRKDVRNLEFPAVPDSARAKQCKD